MTEPGGIKSMKLAAPNAGGSKNKLYIARQESGDVEYFTDELEAHRFAIKGAKCSVEARAPLGRTKPAK